MLRKVKGSIQKPITLNIENIKVQNFETSLEIIKKVISMEYVQAIKNSFGLTICTQSNIYACTSNIKF